MSTEAKDQNKGYRHEDIYANAVRAGKRTYFFDVRSTRAGDLYLTITESKKKFNEDDTFYYQKHKLFLYKEDFEKFADALSDAIKKVIELQNEQTTESINAKFSDVSFDDLGKDGEDSSATGETHTAPAVDENIAQSGDKKNDLQS